MIDVTKMHTFRSTECGLETPCVTGTLLGVNTMVDATRQKTNIGSSDPPPIVMYFGLFGSPADVINSTKFALIGCRVFVLRGAENGHCPQLSVERYCAYT